MADARSASARRTTIPGFLDTSGTHAGTVAGTVSGRHVQASAAAGTASWPAIIAGATAAAALSLILVILGTGLGLSTASPWTGQGASAGMLTASAIAWVCFTQLAAAGMGGYLAGRLRNRWAATNKDEVYFRDTAHGFLAWGLATLITAALLTSAIGTIVGAGTKAAGAAVAAGGTAAAGVAAAEPAPNDRGHGYFVDALFRRGPSPSAGGSTRLAAVTDDASRISGEATRIMAAALGSETLASDDAQYLGQLVAEATGLSQADADKRVTDTFGRMQAHAKELENKARTVADKARKASAQAALWLFVSLLVGAFCASWAATYGGRRRDHSH